MSAREKEYDAVVAGHICLDITPEFTTGGKAVGDILRPGRLVSVGPATVSTGGAVSNTGLTLRHSDGTESPLPPTGYEHFQT